MNALLVFVAQVLSASTPLVFAALGGVVSERAGVATISLEAYLLTGAFAATVTALATGSSALGLAAALVAGALSGMLFAACAVRLRVDAIVAGLAVNLFAAAATRVALKVLYGSASNSPPLTLHAGAAHDAIGVTALRDALSTPTVWLAPAAALALHALFAESALGLRITAVGAHPTAARTQGVDVARVQLIALTLGGAVAALGGAQLALHQREFVAYMSGGRGFLALAPVILGRWRPLPAALWAVGLGATAALEATLSAHPRAPTALLHALPYALTLAAVVAGRAGSRWSTQARAA